MSGTTYRAILTEGDFISPAALAEAEARVYDQPIHQGTDYTGAEGRCALGVIWHIMHPDDHREWMRLPSGIFFLPPPPWTDPTVRARRKALVHILTQNARGLLTTPGSLTALLDTEAGPVRP